MHRHHLALLTTALLVGCATRDATSPVARPATVANAPSRLYAPDIVAYWKFDDAAGSVARDAVGAHHGTLINGPTWVAGKAGGALHFDGVDDYVDAGYGGSDLGQVTTFTIEGWVRRGSTSRWSTTIIAKAAGNGPTGYEYGFGAALTTRYSGRQQLQAWSNEDGYWPWVRSGPAAADDAWSHVAVTCTYVGYAQREFHLYIDGEEVALEEPSGLGLTILADPRIYIGGGFTHGLGFAPDSRFVGDIDELAVYARALTPAEIRRHYENGLQGRGYEEVVAVTIDVRPGSAENPVNAGARGTLPVAVLTTADFDAASLAVSSATLGDGAGSEAAVALRPNGSPMAALTDVDGDGDVDLLLHFDIPALAANGDLRAGTTMLVLQGTTSGGLAVRGTDAVRLIR